MIFTANFGEDGPEMRGNKLVNHGGITFETQELPGAERLESLEMSLWNLTKYASL